MNCCTTRAAAWNPPRWLRTLALPIALFLFVNAQAQNVTVSGAVAGNGSYPTLGAAFNGINAGVQTGANIIVSIDASTNEGGTPAVLTSNSWNSLVIYPSVTGLTVSSATATGRGVIELNGADNVTLNGAVGGTGSVRDLTITNTASNTTTYTSVVRIAVLATTQTSADNIAIRNCNLNGSATGRNLATATSTTGSENTTFGIYAGGNGGATTPTALTSVTTNTAPSGTTINNLTVSNNAVNSCARAVVFNGAVAAVSAGTLAITNNTIGGAGVLGTYPFTTPTNTVYTRGVFVAGCNTLTITGNTLQNILSYVSTTMIGIELNTAINGVVTTIDNNVITAVTNNGTSNGSAGIVMNAQTGGTYSISGNSISNIQDNTSTSQSGISIATSTATSGMIQNNRINTVYARSTGGYCARGILLSAGNNVTIQNNMIWDINMCPNNSATTTSFGAVGIRITSGTGHKVYHNTVSLYGPVFTSTNTDITAAFSLTSTSLTGIDVRNNIFSNTMTGGSATTPHMCIQLPSGGTSAMGLIMNNNALYQGTGPMNYILGTTSPVYYSAANFNAGSTSPSTNMRAYTSTLSAAGTNDNASYATSSPAPFLSATNLHVDNTAPGAAPLNASGSTAPGLTFDIDGDFRGTPPEIGADEFNPAPCGAPVATASVQQNCANNQFYINVSLTNLNGAPSVDIGSNYAGDPGAQLGITTPGSYQIGPFPSATNVTVHVLHNGNHTCDANLSGTYTYDCSTFGQNALSFDGVDDRVNCGDTPSLLSVTSQVTLEAWVYPTAWRTNSYEGSIINKEAPSTQGYMLRCGNNGQLSFNFGTGSAWVEVLSATGALTLNTWQHVAGTYDGANLRIYVNGVQVGTLAATGGINPASTFQLTLGNWSQSNTRGFIGKIDEARVWNTALSQSTIAAMQNQLYCGNETGLIAYYRFDQGVDGANNAGITTLNDGTANANNGTLVGFTLNGSTSNWVQGKTGLAACVPVTCFQPAGLNVTGVTGNSATLNWTNNGSAGYEWEIRTSGLPGSGPAGLTASGTAAGTPVTYSSLSPLTSYTAYVRANCTSPTANSTWAQASFTTPCAILGLPQVQGFNATTIPSCWSQQFITGTSAIQYVSSGSNPTTTPNEGADMVYWNSFNITNNNETRLVSPQLTTVGAASVDVEFDWREENNTSYNAGQYLAEGVTLQYSLNGTSWTDVQFYPRHNAALSAATWMHKVKTVPAAGNQGVVYFGFKFHSGFGDNCFMDKVEFKQTPGCIPPTATATYTPDCANGQFSIVVNVTAVGSGGFVNVVNNGSAPAYNNVGVGSYTVGPFPLASSVTVTVQHGTDPLCNQVFGPYTGTGTLCNDNCTGAYPISCAAGSVAGTNVGATADGAPSQCSGGETTVDNGVWYKFVGNNSTVTLSTCDAGTGFDTRLHVFSGSCGSLVGVAGNDDAGAACSVTTTMSTVTFNAFAGTDYYIAVEGYGTASGSFNLGISCAALCTPVVGNEDCSTAQAITLSTPGTCNNQISGNTDCAASSTTGNPTACFGTFATLPDAFYSFVAPTGSTEITLNYTAPDALGYALYTGTCGSLTYVDCKLTGAGSWLYTLTAGNTYYLRILSNQGTDQGAFTLCVRQFQVPAQDVCPGVDLNTLTSPYTANTTGSTDGGSLPCASNTAPDHVYFIDVPDQTTLRIGDLSSSYNSAHQLLTGAVCPGSTSVSCSTTDLQQESYANTSGSTTRLWWIQDGEGTASGGYQLQWQLLNCIEPAATGSTELINCNTTPQFYVDVVLTSIGNAGSVDIISDQGIGNLTGITTPGTYQIGPFTAGTTANVTVVHNGNNACNKSLGAFTVPASPLCNDFCSGAIALSCGTQVSGTTVGATADNYPSQVSGGCSTIANGVWYSYTPSPAGEQVTVSTCDGQLHDTRIHVFKGTCGALTGVGGNDDAGAQCSSNSTSSTVSFNALPGFTYYIVVENYTATCTSPTASTFTLSTTCGPLCNPLVFNDACVDAQTITMGTNCVQVGGNLSCATSSAGNNPACIGGFNTYPDAYYKFVATAPNAFVTVTGGTNMYLVVYNGTSCNTVSGSEFYCGAVSSGTPVLITGLTTGNTYTVRIMELQANASTFSLCVQKLDVTDDPCAAVPLSCGDLRFGRTTGYLNNIPAGACPFNGAASTGGVNYFSYTAPADADVTFSTCGQTAFNTRVSVFDGDCSSLTCNVMNDDAAGCPGNSSEVTVRAHAGVTYTVMVTGSGSANGNYQLSVFCEPWCAISEANDRCANSTTVTTYVTGTGTPSTETQACSYADAPTSCSGASMVQGVWYDFNTGPNTVFDVYIGVNATNPIYTAPVMNMTLFNGACSGVGANNELLCQTNCNGTLNLPTLTPNTTYRLLVYNTGGTNEGTFGLKISHPGFRDAGISSIVQPIGTVCDQKLFPQVYLHNYGEAPLSSAQIISRIDGIPVQTYNWSGSAVLRGDSVLVSLPVITSPLDQHTYSAEVSTVNGGVDELATNNSSSSLYDASGQTVKVQVKTDANPAQTSWIIFDAFFFPVGQSGTLTANAVNTTSICLPTTFGNCFYFFLNDQAGDGIANGGGWQLLDALDRPILGDNGTFGQQSPPFTPATAGYIAHEFCLPLGPTAPLSSECSVFNNLLANKVFCNTVAGVVNYQFEFSDPNAGYRRRISVPRNWVKFSEMQTNPLVFGTTYFCRVRVDQNASGFADDYFGAGCEMALAPTQPICTELISTPGPTLSCGVTKTFGGSDKIYAQPVTAATQYRFNFSNTGLGYSRTILKPSYVCLLSWVTQPLVSGNTYQVKVEAYVSGVWSGFCGATCPVTIANPNAQGGQLNSLQVEENTSTVTLWPNPVRDGRFNLNLGGLTEEQQKVTVDIYDIFGKRVMAGNYDNSGNTFQRTIDLPQGIAAGVYTVNITINGTVTTKRLTVQ